jgi:uncharacterized protein (TIGR02452 family)
MYIQRVKCWEDTKNMCNKYIPTPPISVKHVYNKVIMPHKYKKTNISTINLDTIDCGLSLIHENPVLLNLANDRSPGGGVGHGCSAQEESLFRRTNYFQTLLPKMYPIKHNELIYSPNVSVIKTTDWQYIHKPFKMSFIACPGLHDPVLINGELSASDIQLLKYKIHHILQTAIHYGHYTVILGALGCGAWHNPPRQVAYIFKEVLSEYNMVFKQIVFAVTGDNYYAFSDIL